MRTSHKTGPLLGLATLAALGLTAAPPVHAQAPLTELIMHSQPGDYIGDGRDYDFTTADTTFSVNLYSFNSVPDSYVSFSFAPTNGDYEDANYGFLDFSTQQLGHPLAPGEYDNAQRAAFADPGHPGIDVTLYDRGSNTLTGKFTILDATFAPDTATGQDTVTSFAATFEQHSEGSQPALFGTLFYNFTPAPEPSAFIGLGMGMFGLGALTLRARRRTAGAGV